MYPKYLQEWRNGETETLYLRDAFPRSHVKKPHTNSKHMYVLAT